MTTTTNKIHWEFGDRAEKTTYEANLVGIDDYGNLYEAQGLMGGGEIQKVYNITVNDKERFEVESILREVGFKPFGGHYKHDYYGHMLLDDFTKEQLVASIFHQGRMHKAREVFKALEIKKLF